jgi:hypothetical protein
VVAAAWAMAAQTFLLAAAAPPAAIFATPSSPARPFHSLRLVAAAARAHVVADATKKAVAVLKGTSGVEGVVTLTQEDDGACCFPFYSSRCLLSLSRSFSDVLGGKRTDLYPPS